MDSAPAWSVLTFIEIWPVLSITENYSPLSSLAVLEKLPAVDGETLRWDSMSAHITIAHLPAAPQNVFFDEYVVVKHYPVAVRFTGGGNCESNGIDFGDYSRMTTSERKCFSGRRTTVPLWAVNNHDLQRVLVAYLDRRAYGARNKFSEGTFLERLMRAERQLAERAPRTQRQLDKLCGRYVELRRNGGAPKELATLQRAINGLDTQLIINRAPARIAAAVVYKFFRQGLKSTQIAADLGLHSPGVRQMLFRIQKVATALGYPEPERITSYPREPKSINRSLAMKVSWAKKKAAAQSAAKSESGRLVSLQPPGAKVRKVGLIPIFPNLKARDKSRVDYVHKTLLRFEFTNDPAQNLHFIVNGVDVCHAAVNAPDTQYTEPEQ